ncbi:MAG TPA: ribosomal protein S18-alanine N-acetyltransferase [Candidatus Tyrphobacter sp.]
MKLELDPSAAGERLAIAPMTHGDVGDVVRIEREAFVTQWPADAFYNELNSNKLAHYFVGRCDGKIVAYGGIWVILEDSHITTIAVERGYRGRSFGEVMLLRLIDEAMARGSSWMTLEVRESNVVAQRLYRKYGFTTVTTRKGYYGDNDESALVMWAGNLKSELYRNRLGALREAIASR